MEGVPTRILGPQSLDGIVPGHFLLMRGRLGKPRSLLGFAPVHWPIWSAGFPTRTPTPQGWHLLPRAFTPHGRAAWKATLPIGLRAGSLANMERGFPNPHSDPAGVASPPPGIHTSCAGGLESHAPYRASRRAFAGHLPSLAAFLTGTGGGDTVAEAIVETILPWWNRAALMRVPTGTAKGAENTGADAEGSAPSLV